MSIHVCCIGWGLGYPGTHVAFVALANFKVAFVALANFKVVLVAVANNNGAYRNL